MDEPTRMPLGNFDLRLLPALAALLNERSVTRAAQRLALTQPAMSGTLARLRAVFGDELLVRTGRTMQLTPLAESLIVPVGELMTGIEQVVSSRQNFDPRRDARQFTLVAQDYALMVIIRPALASLAAEAPYVRIRVRSSGFRDLPSLLHRGEIDMAIVPEPLSRRLGLPRETLLSDRFVGVVWRGNKEVSDPMTLAELTRLPYLAYGLGSAPSMVDAVLREHGLSNHPDMLVESFVVGVNMIRGTRQVTFVQERLARLFASRNGLRRVEPPVPLPELIETITWHPRATNDPAHRWLRERLRQIATDL